MTEVHPVAEEGDGTLAVVLPAEPSSVGIARSVVGAVADRVVPGWGDRVRLAVSELVTNAVVHAGTPIEVRARWDGDALRVEVHDERPARPVHRLRSVDQVRGWGLRLVELAVGSWACEVNSSHGGGKAVWFEVDPTAAP